MSDKSSVSLRILASYGAVGLPVAVLALPVYVYLPTLYTQELGLSLSAIAAILFGMRAVDAIADPIIGWLSDRTETPFGRRKPWVVASVPVTILATYMLFVPPADATAAYVFGWGVTLTIGWTALILPFNAWGAELTGDYHARTRVTAARQIFALLGTMVATALPALLTVYGIVGLRDHVSALAWIIIILLPLTVAIAALSVPERPPLTVERLPWIRGLTQPLRNPDFRRLIAAFFINAVANGLPVTLFIPFVTHRLGMQDAYGPLLFTYFVSGLVAIPVWTWASSRIGKHRSWAIAMIWACLAFLWTPIFVGEGDFTLFLIITILSGFGVGADLAIPSAILADVVDEDTAASGEERTGLYFALWGLSTQISLGVAGALAFLPLEAVGFDAAGETNTPLALTTLAWIYAGLPVALKLIAVAVMWNFPLDAARQRTFRERIESAV